MEYATEVLSTAVSSHSSTIKSTDLACNFSNYIYFWALYFQGPYKRLWDEKVKNYIFLTYFFRLLYTDSTNSVPKKIFNWKTTDFKKIVKKKIKD